MKDEDIDKIVDMLDTAFSKKGVGHVNLKSDEKQEELLKEVTSEQCGIKTPCSIGNFENIEDRRRL